MHKDKRFSIATRGLWSRRHDLKTVLNAKVQFRPLAIPHATDGYLGWGDKPSSVRTLKIADKIGSRLIRLEDGFLKGWSSGPSSPSVSYVVDDIGIYYNAHKPSLLENIITTESLLTSDILERSRTCINEIVEAKLSKYNDSPVIDLSQLDIGNKKYILLVDQVMGDQSITGAMSNSDTFLDMLKYASTNHPDCEIVIKAHPASNRQDGPLLEAAGKLNIECKIIREKVNLWPFIQECEHFYTVSSQTGFEALMAGKPVTCFGMPFYAGWGLTNDILTSDRRKHKKSLEEIFAAAYIHYSRYLGLHDRKLTTIENTIDELTWLTKTRRRNGCHYLTTEMSYRKYRTLAPLLQGMGQQPFNFKRSREAIKYQHTWPKSKLAVWGQDTLDQNTPQGLEIHRIEDGFIRSVGLGAAFSRPYSVVVDSSGHLHFDRRGESGIEKLLNNFEAKPKQLARAKKMQERIVQERINKYMLAGSITKLPSIEGKLRILIPGQVEGDASLRYGSPEISKNTVLINKVRQLFPDAFIAFKEHPDVASGLRPGKADTSAADLVVTNYSIADLLSWCDRVETMTSLTGFEALIYGKDVGTHGYPFYAGWGFTTDRISDQYKRERRKLKSFLELLYVTLYEYPIYIHPTSELPCSPEALIDTLTTTTPTRCHKIKSGALTMFGRMRLKWKQTLIPFSIKTSD